MDLMQLTYEHNLTDSIEVKLKHPAFNDDLGITLHAHSLRSNKVAQAKIDWSSENEGKQPRLFDILALAVVKIDGVIQFGDKKITKATDKKKLAEAFESLDFMTDQVFGAISDIKNFYPKPQKS